MVLGCRVTSSPNDKQELAPTVEAVDATVRAPSHVLADTGYASAQQVEAVENDGGPTVYVATEKTGHGRRVADLERKPEPEDLPEDATTLDKVKHRMRTGQGRALYKLRKETVEPVFGIVKQVMGFRQFHLRGHPKADLEWALVCLAYNARRLFKLSDSGRLLRNAGFCTAKA